MTGRPANRRRRSAYQIAAGLDLDGNYLDGAGQQEARWLGGLTWHERKRYETLKREWEQWRSELEPDRRGPMLRLGERECRYCGTFFEPNTLRQRYCKSFKPTNPNYCRQMAGKARSKSTKRSSR